MSLPVYQVGDAEQYCNEKGWKLRQTGDQVNLQTCPFCGKNDWRFYINNDNGLFACHHGKCGRKGNFFQLQRELGDLKPLKPASSQRDERAKRLRKAVTFEQFSTAEKALWADTEALTYCHGRGLTDETIKHWHLGLRALPDGSKFLLIPYVLDGMIVDAKRRYISGPTEQRYGRTGGDDGDVLFGEQTLKEPVDDGARVLYLTEGELDALTLWQHGYRPVVSTTCGTGTFKSRWYDLITQYDPDTLVVCYDSDPQGQDGATKVLKKFDDRRVLNVVFPESKDANEFFQSHTKEAFDQLIVEAEPPEMEEARTLASVADSLETRLFLDADGVPGLPSQFEQLNQMIGGGYRNGFLVTISGNAGIGKTSFVLQELLRHAKMGTPVYLNCLEMPEEMMYQKLVEHEFHVPILEQKLEHIQKFRKHFDSIPLILGSKAKGIDNLEQVVRKAVKRYDLKMFAFDNLNYLVRSMQHVTQEIAIITKRLKELAVELNIPIFLIAQPRKFDDNERMININDLKDSAAVAQDSDVVMLLSRSRLQPKMSEIGGSGVFGIHSPFARLQVAKSRYSAGGAMILYFDGAKSTYRELTKDELEFLRTSEAAQANDKKGRKVA